ncbi:hypothetical protein ACP70R_034774 [Stipagrostis hirtigluma subsp. patula]
MEVEAQCGLLPTRRGRHHLHGRPRHQPQGGDDEWWEYFPCPFCYIEVEVPFLCDHLQEEHCFDMKNAVCPICADRLGNDTAAHFRIQHSHLLKRRMSSSKTSPSAEKEADEDEDDYIEAPSHCMGRQSPDTTPDPLLSQFICGIALMDSMPGQFEEDDVSPILDDQRPDQSVMDDDSQKDIEERLQRVEFVKQMLMTIIA